MRVALLALLLASACVSYDERSVVYYDFARLPVPAAGETYQHFVDIGGYAVSLGCFAVESRQVDCNDAMATGEPRYRPVIVECECPCDATIPNPCDDAARPSVLAGVVRGTVSHTDAPVSAGGSEFPTSKDLSEARSLFITQETDDDPAPTGRVILAAPLYRDGGVLHGSLARKSALDVTGQVTILTVEDGESL